MHKDKKINVFDESVIENTVTGEKIVFTKTTKETGGETLGFDFYASAHGGGVPFAHYHAKQTEYFKMIEGELTVMLDGEERVLREGDEITLPPKTKHWLINRGSVEARCYVEYRPARRSEWWFRVIHPYQSAIGKEPGLLDIAPFLSKGVETYPADVPYAAGKVLIFVAGLVGTLLGRKRKVLRIIEEHCGPEAARLVNLG